MMVDSRFCCWKNLNSERHVLWYQTHLNASKYQTSRESGVFTKVPGSIPPPDCCFEKHWAGLASILKLFRQSIGSSTCLLPRVLKFPHQSQWPWKRRQRGPRSLWQRQLWQTILWCEQMMMHPGFKSKTAPWCVCVCYPIFHVELLQLILENRVIETWCFGALTNWEKLMAPCF